MLQLHIKTVIVIGQPYLGYVECYRFAPLTHVCPHIYCPHNSLYPTYGFSNLYLIVYFRKKENYIIGLLEFILIFMGNVKNYLNMNRRFRKRVELDGNNMLFNKCISIIHLISPILIPIAILSWVLSIVFYWSVQCVRKTGTSYITPVKTKMIVDKQL